MRGGRAPWCLCPVRIATAMCAGCLAVPRRSVVTGGRAGYAFAGGFGRDAQRCWRWRRPHSMRFGAAWCGVARPDRRATACWGACWRGWPWLPVVRRSCGNASGWPQRLQPGPMTVVDPALDARRDYKHGYRRKWRLPVCSTRWCRPSGAWWHGGACRFLQRSPEFCVRARLHARGAHTHSGAVAARGHGACRAGSRPTAC